MLKFVKYLLGVGLVASSGAVAAAVDLPPDVIDRVMASCRPDYHRLCSYVVPGGGRVARCLLDHETELAPPCLRSIKLAYAMEVCMPDYRRFCDGLAPRGGQVLGCLGSRFDTLAPECQRIVSANAPYADPGLRYGYDRAPYGGPSTNPEAYRYEPSAPYSDHPYDERYADHGYPTKPYSDGRYDDRGYNNPGYRQPGQNDAEENAPLK